MQQLPAATGAAGPQARNDRTKMQATRAAAGHHTHTTAELLGMQNPAARAEAAVLDSIPHVGNQAKAYRGPSQRLPGGDEDHAGRRCKRWHC